MAVDLVQASITRVDARLIGIAAPSYVQPQSGTDADRKLAAILRAKHPVYDSWAPWWKLYLDAYNGGPDVVGYITKHSREHQEDFETRKKRSYYVNYTADIVDQGPSFVFHRPISRVEQPLPEPPSPMKEVVKIPAVPPTPNLEAPETEDAVLEATPPASDEMQDFWKDCDGQGHDINAFMKHQAERARIFGHTFVLVDSPRVDPPLQSEQDRRERNIRPYLVEFNPLEMTNWEIDRDKRFRWVRFKERELGTVGPLEERQDSAEIYLTFTRDGWIRHKVVEKNSKVSVTVVDEGEHGLGVVPVVTVINIPYDSYPWIGSSLIRDIGPCNIAAFNWCSLIDEDIYTRCLNVLVAKKGEADGESITLSHSNVLEYSGDVPPTYLAPSGEPIAMIQAMLEFLKNEMFRMGKLGATTGVPQRESRSGVAYSFEFNETSQELGRLADQLQDAETKIHVIFKKWFQQEWEGVIDYPEEFGVELMKDELEVTALAKATVRSPTFGKVMEKQIARKMVGKASELTKQRIDAEIDAMPEKEVQVQAAATALQSQAEQQAQDQQDQQAQDGTGGGDGGAG